MHKAQSVTGDEVRKIAKLANLPLPDDQVEKFADQFSRTVEVVNELNEIDTLGLPETYQVNNLVNVFREDVADTQRTFSQEQALSQSGESHDGFFVVPRVIDSSEEDL